MSVQTASVQTDSDLSQHIDLAHAIALPARLEIVPFGTAAAAALALGYALCIAMASIFPYVPLAQGWSMLFSVAPLGSFENWAQGLIGSLAFGALFGSLTAVAYNAIARR